MKHHALPLIASVLGVLSLAGCAHRLPLSREQVSGLLRAQMTATCDHQTVAVRAGRFGTGRADQALRWFDKAVLQDPAFLKSTESHAGVVRRGRFTYQDGGHVFRADWSEVEQPVAPLSDKLSVSTCLYVPDTIAVIDTSFDAAGSTARVLFQAKYRLSLLGRKIDEAGLLQTYLPNSAPPEYEYVAELALTRGAWHVTAVNVN